MASLSYVSGAFAASAALLLASCGGEDAGPSASSGVTDCPPQVKSGGLSVGSRVNIDEAIQYTFWMTDYPPLSCAGDLADLIPSLPAGYGLAPTTLTRLPLMGDDHIAFSLGEMPADLMTQYDTANVPLDMKRIDYEVVRFTSGEMSNMRAWFSNNPGSYFTKTFEGQEIYLAGAVATMRPGKPGRIGAGLTLLMKDNLVLRISYTDMLVQLSGKENPMPNKAGNPALELLATMIEKAKAAGKL